MLKGAQPLYLTSNLKRFGEFNLKLNRPPEPWIKDSVFQQAAGSLRVIKTVSLQKQITGEEVGAGIFRFFGDELFDLNMGTKNQEPLQLGVRTTLEQATLELVGAVTGVFAPLCIYEASYTPEQRNAAALRAAAAAACNCDVDAPKQAAPVAPAQAPAAAEPTAPTVKGEAVNRKQAEDATGATAVLMPQNGLGGGDSKFQVGFDFGGDSLGGRSLAAVERIVAEVMQGRAVDFEVIASDSESWSPQKRQELTNARIRAIVDAMVQRGLKPAWISKTWEPALSDTGITRDGAGFQIFAKMRAARR